MILYSVSRNAACLFFFAMVLSVNTLWIINLYVIKHPFENFIDAITSWLLLFAFCFFVMVLSVYFLLPFIKFSFDFHFDLACSLIFLFILFSIFLLRSRWNYLQIMNKKNIQRIFYDQVKVILTVSSKLSTTTSGDMPGNSFILTRNV